MNDVEYLFMCLLAIFMSSLEKYLSLFDPSFDLVIYFSSTELHELLVYLFNSLLVALLVASLAFIFSHSEGCLFTLLIVSFIVQKLLSLIKSHLLIFAFVFFILWGGHRRSCCELRKRLSCLCFTLRLL